MFFFLLVVSSFFSCIVLPVSLLADNFFLLQELADKIFVLRERTESEKKHIASLEQLALQALCNEKNIKQTVRQLATFCEDLSQPLAQEFTILCLLLQKYPHYEALVKQELLGLYPALWSSTIKKKILRGHLSTVQRLALSSDNSILASGSADGSVLLFKLPEGEKIMSRYFGPFRHIASLAIETDRPRLLVGTSNGEIFLINYDTNTTFSHKDYYIEELPLGCCFLSREEQLAVLFSQWLLLIPEKPGLFIERYYFKSGEQDTLFGTHDKKIDIFGALTYSKHEELLILSRSDGMIQLRKKNMMTDPPTMIIQHLPGHLETVTALELSPQEHLLASSSLDKSIRLWSMEERSCVKTFFDHADWVMGLSWLGGSQFLCSVDAAGELFIWDRTQEHAVMRSKNTTASYYCVTATTDGACIMTGDDSGLITLWQTPLALSVEQLLLLNALKTHPSSHVGWDVFWYEIYEGLCHVLPAYHMTHQKNRSKNHATLLKKAKSAVGLVAQVRRRNVLRRLTNQRSLRRPVCNQPGHPLYDQPCRHAPKRP